MLDPRRLRVLVEIERRGSFAAAAQALSFTPSAVSQQIAALERETGTRLFERGARGVRLTDAGRALAAHAEAVLARLADAETELDAISGRRAGRLRFGSFPTATAVFGAAAGELFRERYPEIQFSYTDAEPYEIARLLRARELDLALTFTYDRWPVGARYDGVVVSSDEEVEYLDLFDDPFLVVLPLAHRLAAVEVVPIPELAPERVLGGPPWGPDFRHLCNLAGFEPTFDPSYRTPDFHAFQAFVAYGRGLTLLPRLALTALREDVIVRPLAPAPVRHVRIAMPRDAYHSPAMEAMHEILLELAHQLPYEG